MKLFQLALSFIKDKKLSALLSILLFAFGVAIVSIIFALDKHVNERIQKDIAGIGLVVGAKGSPMQLILCNVLHADYPTGNISLKEAQKIAKNPLVKKAIPLALGDSYKGFRIVGTDHSFAEHYQFRLKEGFWWEHEMEVCIGAEVAEYLGLKLGDTFYGAHGMEKEEMHVHDEHEYTVVGILKPSGGISDKLIFTFIQSVWMVHEGHNHNHDEHEEEHDHAHHHHHHHHPESVLKLKDAEGKEITSLLLIFRNPMGAIQLPRMINSETNMQAASPAFEMARLNAIIGTGADVLKVFALLIIILSIISIFISLFTSLKERKFELAMLRVMGASQSKLFLLIVYEGITLSVLGWLSGIIISKLALFFIISIAGNNEVFIPSYTTFTHLDFILLPISVLLGIIAAFAPAFMAYKNNISKTLSQE